MDLVLITNPSTLMNEQGTINELFDAGLERLHIRKPGFDNDQMMNYLNRITKAHRAKSSIHGFEPVGLKYKFDGYHGPLSESSEHFNTLSCSIHSLDELDKLDERYQYAFLSPIFDSISKPGYKAAFTEEELKTALEKYSGKTKIYALGGINESNVKQAHELGFNGVAVLGAVWQHVWSHKLLGSFKNILEQCKQLG